MLVNETEHFLTQAEANQVFLDYIPQYFEDGAPLSIGLEGFFSYNKYRNKISALFDRRTLDLLAFISRCFIRVLVAVLQGLNKITEYVRRAPVGFLDGVEIAVCRFHLRMT